ncbi:acetyl-CoA carboxylase biotin carboxylase subunit family protein [Pseudoalteromonas sp. MMG012]|uniref:ATP-grasp domain-containing protein n=1 Tax=Pseudoalteromonas sp. MMG012 TaxID=2822686 RepID=UPI001B3A10EC|nr:ATP-grasp domain-containing protein [Pseudoalteromonas sp. MMG012]MBQ4849997.1 ATP-grasp domain-containing protein [Pseudoalteromonas sp. MMG012]
MTKQMLIIARGEYESFLKLDGSSIFDNLPCGGVILADKGNEKVFGRLTDKFKVETIRFSDEHTLLEKAQQLHLEYQFSAVATLDESNIGLAARTRELLKIEGMQSDEGLRFRDKVAMKQQLKNTNVKFPQYTCCADLEAASGMLKQFGKLVIKPKDGFGSKEVVFVSTDSELQEWAKKHESNLARFEAEEFIEGQLFHINAMIINGETKLTAPAAYLPGMSNIDFSAGTPFISVIVEDEQLKQALIEFSDQVNAAFEIKNGVTHLECFVSPSGELTFCEVGLRPGGGGIVWMIESQYGVNYSEAVLAIEAGCTGILPKINTQRVDVAGLIGIRSNISGFVTDCMSVDDLADKRIKLKQSFVQPGSFKAASAHCTDFLSLFVFDSKNTDEFHLMWRDIQQQFQKNLSFTTI